MGRNRLALISILEQVRSSPPLNAALPTSIYIYNCYYIIMVDIRTHTHTVFDRKGLLGNKMRSVFNCVLNSFSIIKFLSTNRTEEQLQITGRPTLRNIRNQLVDTSFISGYVYSNIFTM